MPHYYTNTLQSDTGDAVNIDDRTLCIFLNSQQNQHFFKT